LNASVPAAVSLIKGKIGVQPLDDLFPADSVQIRGKQEETLSEITRYIADGVEPARMRGKTVSLDPPTCGVMFIGEYIVGTGSDAARLLPVEHTQPDSEKLKWFQDHPLLVSTFYRGFIQWYITHYFEIRELLTEWLDIYRHTSFGVHDRLRETHYFLGTAYAILLQYASELGVVSEQDAQKMYGSFCDLLTDLVEDQQQRVDQGKLNVRADIDYLAAIRTLYKNGKFRLADNAKIFDDDSYDGVLHNGCLCLRKNRLSGFFPNVALDRVIDSLESQNAIERGSDKIEKQIAATGGKRFYFIPLISIQ